MAAQVGISASSVQRIWRDNDLKPRLRRTFKLSNDERFAEKFWDVIGLYLDPPDRALVSCCDEMTRCQALERTQPELPRAAAGPLGPCAWCIAPYLPVR